MKLVWLDINASYSHSSLALAALESNKTDNTIEWDSVNGTTSGDIFSITKAVLEKKPDVIAATLWLFNHEVVIKICKRIKAALPSATIILGGPEFDGDNKNFLAKNPQISCVLRGEGEIVFHQWLEVYRSKEEWHKIEGLCFLDSNNIYFDNGKAKVKEFAQLNFPEQSPFFNKQSPFVQLETSRGCFNSCAFCTSGGDTPIRSLSLEQIKKRLEYIDQLGIKEIRLLDRTFNYSATRAIAILELFKRYPDSNFHLEIHPALLTSPQLKMTLASMPEGIVHIEAGLQSLSDEVVVASGRLGNSDKAIEGVKFLCSQSNFETHTDLIAGLPKYTLSQIFADIKTLSNINAGEIQLELLKLLPGTVMRKEAAKHGIIYADDTPYEVLQTDHITMEELDKARLLSKLIDKFYNAKGWQSITRRLINENNEFLEKFFAYMLSTELLDYPLSLEKRGSLLYAFCKEHYNNYLIEISLQWISNGMSLKKEEAGTVFKITNPDAELPQNLRYYALTSQKNGGYLIGFDRSKEHSKPVFCKSL